MNKNIQINLEKLSKAFQGKKLFCMDLEFHEKRKLLTEIGISILDEDSNQVTYHFIVEETLELRNGKYVPDNKDNFLFGTSEILSLNEIEKKVYDLVQDTDFLVGHAFKNDRAFLAQSGYFKQAEVLDTITFSKLLLKEQMSLKRLLEYFTINYDKLHNAGNDSFYTLEVLKKINEKGQTMLLR